MNRLERYKVEKRNKLIKKIVTKAGIATAVWYFPVAAPVAIFTYSAYKIYMDYENNTF
jgi:hypothetical protein